jgi:AraC-like DNA-binding protein
VKECSLSPAKNNDAELLTMTMALSDINDWPVRSRADGYRVDELAAICEVSIWQFDQFFRSTTAMAPRQWLFRLKQMDALWLLGLAWSKKEVAAALHYKHAPHFWRAFRDAHRMTPGAAMRDHV